MVRRPRCSSRAMPQVQDEGSSAVTAWLDRWAGEVIVTLSVPEHLARVAAEAIEDLSRACSVGGNDVRVAELAGVLVGLLDGMQVVQRPPQTLEAAVDA